MPVAEKNCVLDLVQNSYKNYFELMSLFLNTNIHYAEKEQESRIFLTQILGSIHLENINFPNEISEVKEWFKQENKQAGEAYQGYLSRRLANGDREYFQNIGQAFEFLIRIAPIKKVDGSWLYSLVNYWNDPAFHDLILIYLEELGLGLAQANHVCIYDELLKALGLDDFETYIDDEYYQQAVIQLALAYAPADFIPEIIGFNLGYEQLPLHLLITNYELQELGINSKYFNLHITIDNLASGHAQKSIKALENIYNNYPDKEKFIKKLKRGYALNQEGMGSTQIIQSLDLENFVHNILKRKALVGQWVHNEKREFSCKTINQWLSNPNEIASFINQLIENKWIKLNKNPEESLFWKMIHHEDGKMYGVFSPTEKQIIHDWIAGGQYSSTVLVQGKNINSRAQQIQEFRCNTIADIELTHLKSSLTQNNNISISFTKLIPFLAPHSHHQNIGLWCTQKYSELLFPYLTNLKIG